MPTHAHARSKNKTGGGVSASSSAISYISDAFYWKFLINVGGGSVTQVTPKLGIC
jgi:hypothetical protein